MSSDPHACASGWICEAHPDQPMGHDGCDAPGVPCPICQPEGKPIVKWDELIDSVD